ncbi:MAG: dodecin domain-containing protein [Chloroflexi bacterium]|nr:dodecin domain-containing protein [Chloroflexota bacterium]
MAKVAKVIELVGSSEKSWDDAVEAAVKSAAQTLHGITGVEVLHWTAKIKDGKITDYKATVKVAFGVET